MMKRRFILFIPAVCFALIGYGQQLKIASYNVRNQNSNDAKQGNGWEQRLPAICNLVQYHNFDIWGAQEVLHGQLEDLLGCLSDYTYVGVGRDDGKTKGEYAPIFWKKDKFELLESGHFWLSEETTYPNKGWDAALPRICTWGHFKEKETGTVFWFFNLHMDHRGVVAREKSAALVLEKIRAMASSDPVVLTGDFNVDQTHANYAVIHDSGLLVDAYEVAALRYAPTGTFNNFDINLKTNSRIDHIFLSPTIQVERYGLLTDFYFSTTEVPADSVKSANFPDEVSLIKHRARLPSDHNPVVVTVNF
ncbi:endonuclease/exonuclease/phosphatase family protein [Parapedobacter sp. 10938]|uniref:endonuclease/exonuclease/phosphatase family protein n=1 Tax=Parapedobacter flavus TaxID=3110225 RepID=UPI002DBBB8A4|nr:endonuclease/exonuclease/phosphatase family protein [Parapedobacter sp. 10938]MEC3878163.1 endonuclease/exonuclease/phosphatase family protein [Parapedobacter sp. 10938]